MSNPTDRPATQQERVEYRRLYYLAFPEKVRELSRRKVAKDPEKYRSYRKQWGIDNEKHHKQQRQGYYLKNADEIKTKCKDYYHNNKAKLRPVKRKREAFRRKHDINFKLKQTLRSRLYEALRGRSRASSTMKLLGCSVESLRIYLESKFEPGMSWENYGRNGWHVDHIVPCAIFDLTNPNHQKYCFHFSNLQPLWATDNRTKGWKLKDNQLPLSL